MATVFISHSSQDKTFARKLANDLHILGHEPWLDEWQIQVGDCIVSQLQRGLADSEFVILILSPESVASGWVDREWKATYWSEINGTRRKLLPALLRRCDMPGFLAGLRYADFTSDFSEGFSALASALSGEAVIKVVTPSDTSTRVTTLEERLPERISIRIEITTSGLIFDAEVATNLKVKEIKREIMRSQGYSDQFLDGRVAETFLYSKTRRLQLDDSRTVEENGILDGEVIRLHFFCEAG